VSRTDAILKRLLALHPNKLIDLSLGRIERLLEELGRPQDRLPPVIHVAGTNGKGSTIAFLRAFLEAAEQRVHVYTSPNLVRFNERIRVAGRIVSSRGLNKALEHCETVNDGRPITYFEITTAAAILLFSKTPADYLLLEVGLGGRYDATNVVDHPLGAVIAPVSRDHEEFLGDTLGKIAREKAGILKRGAPAVIGRQAPEALEAIANEARALDISPLVMGQDFDGYEQGGRLIFQDGTGLLDLPAPALPGDFQYANAALAIAAARHFRLPVSESALAEGLRRVEWPARMMPLTTGRLRDLLPAGHELWLDGGHNEAGAAVLADAVKGLDRRDPKPLVMIMGTFANKDAKAFMSHFAGMADRVVTVRIPGERQSWSGRELADLAEEAGFRAAPKRSLKAALEEAAKVPAARVLICGSLHLAGNVLARNGTRLT